MFIFKLFTYPYRLIRWCFRSLTQLMLFLFLLLFFVALGTFIAAWDEYEKSQQPPEQIGILVFDVQGAILDDPLYEAPLYELLSELDDQVSPNRENSLFELTAKINQAAADPNIKALILKLDALSSVSFTALDDLAVSLMNFKKTDKKIYAIGGNYDLKRYYLAAIAHEIELLPQGNIELYGLSAQQLYFKSLLDKLAIEPQVFKVGTYKSAVEPFMRNSMSDPAKQNLSRWVHLLWNHYLEKISEFRQAPKDQLVPAPKDLLAALKQTNGNQAQYAQNNRIIDNVMSAPVFDDLIKQRYPESPLLSIYDYELHKPSMDFAPISVVFVEGTITDGKSQRDVAGSKSVIQALEEAIERKSAAIVLRINSPGGGVFASEAIRQQLVAIRKQHIPIVVSMGSLAASGGYWIATESDYIYANQDTLTGSIGIFGMIPNVKGTLNRFGVYTDGVQTSSLAGQSILNPLTADQAAVFQLQIENGYQTFIDLVAEARKMTPNEVDAIAQGQVWLGQEALANGLIDEIGSLDSAIQKAAQLAHLEQYSVFMPEQKATFFEKLFLANQVNLPTFIQDYFSVAAPFLSEIKATSDLMSRLNDPKGQYLFCLNCPH